MKVRRLKANRPTREPREVVMLTSLQPSKRRPYIIWNPDTNCAEIHMPYTPAPGETFRIHVYSSEPV